MSDLQEIARRLGAEERTLRRAVQQGTVRSLRPSPRRLSLTPDEERYLTRNWSLLSALRRALRTERRARLAVLFGSESRGDASFSSDVDLLVGGPGWDSLARARLSVRLARATGRRVHVVLLEEAFASPTLLADVLVEGRVLIDRDRTWPELERRREEVRRDARRAEDLTARRAAAAVAEARARLA